MSSRLELASSGSLFPSLSAAAHSWLLIYLLPAPWFVLRPRGSFTIVVITRSCPYTVRKFSASQSQTTIFQKRNPRSREGQRLL